MYFWSRLLESLLQIIMNIVETKLRYLKQLYSFYQIVCAHCLNFKLKSFRVFISSENGTILHSKLVFKMYYFELYWYYKTFGNTVFLYRASKKKVGLANYSCFVIALVLLSSQKNKLGKVSIKLNSLWLFWV